MTAFRNELNNSQNPYLLQHKDNPVAWKMWGENAFEEARQRNVPLLVSIGYSTCHWCHVMAHEVFEDNETATIMNNYLVSVKVDREEHPEVDEVYMEACQAMNGSGGWPLNVFIDHEGKPFFAATYVPRKEWNNLILNINKAWNTNHDEIGNFAVQLTDALQNNTIENNSNENNLKKDLFSYLYENYDELHPDFSSKGTGPRFPSHTLYYFLLSLREIPLQISSMLESVLEAIQDSGLHDRVGGGFHRYSTDREWRVPHFEKMLYDNAQMITTYTLAASRFNRPDFLATAENTASYLIRDMAIHKNGLFQGFASAEDADDPGGEGSFYAWTPSTLQQALGKNIGGKLASEWNITDNQSNIHGVFHYRIPHPRGSSAFQNLTIEERINLRNEWEAHVNQLLNQRQQRSRPFLDDKILTDYNALALLGLALLYAHTLKSVYVNTAKDIAKVLTERFKENTMERLPGKKGHLTDYGHTALALFTLWEVTGDTSFLQTASNVVKSAFEKFVTADGKVYTSDNDSIFMKFEEKFDHAQPAGTHTLLLSWIRLNALGRLDEYRQLVKTIIEKRLQRVTKYPIMVPSFLQLLHEFEEGPVTLSLPANFRENDLDLLKWVGTEIRLIPDPNRISFQWCEKDKCLLPVYSSSELGIKFSWK